MSRRIPLIEGDRNTSALYAWRVMRAHQILSGIPGRRIHLANFYAPGTEQNLCDTIACGAGWLALHPSFQEFGLRPYTLGGEWKAVQYTGLHEGDMHYGFEALNRVFASGDENSDTSYCIVDNLFDARTYGDWDDVLLRLLKTSKDKYATDKELLLMRLRYAYQHHCGRAGR